MDLSVRMKQYEELYDTRVMPNAPLLARLDGRAFHTLCKDMERPYDWRMAACMQSTAVELLEEFNARLVYSQSDEITLLWYSSGPDAEYLFGGRVNKLNSVLAAFASVVFNDLYQFFFRTDKSPRALFDCRVWSVPNRVEAANVFVWRELDAMRNSIMSACQSVYSDTALYGKDQEEQHEMLHAAGIHWGDYPSYFKRGAYWRRVPEKRRFTEEEISNLPPKHAARTNPSFEYIRTKTKSMNLPNILSIGNREDVLFDGDPIILIGGEKDGR